jgi:hypothetical protein
VPVTYPELLTPDAATSRSLVKFEGVVDPEDILAISRILCDVSIPETSEGVQMVLRYIMNMTRRYKLDHFCLAAIELFVMRALRSSLGLWVHSTMGSVRLAMLSCSAAMAMTTAPSKEGYQANLASIYRAVFRGRKFSEDFFELSSTYKFDWRVTLRQLSETRYGSHLSARSPPPPASTW